MSGVTFHLVSKYKEVHKTVGFDKKKVVKTRPLPPISRSEPISTNKLLQKSFFQSHQKKFYPFPTLNFNFNIWKISFFALITAVECSCNPRLKSFVSTGIMPKLFIKPDRKHFEKLFKTHTGSRPKELIFNWKPDLGE